MLVNFRNPSTTIPDISASRERIIAFDASSKSVVSDSDTYVPSNILPEYSTGSCRRNEYTDSDETTHESSISRSRHTRPPRKSKRKNTVTSMDREQATVTCPDTIVAPSSSGYQSQNHSSR